MLKCPRCGEPEILRKQIGNKQFVLFRCLFSVYLPIGKNDKKLQQILDKWEKRCGMDEWLKASTVNSNMNKETKKMIQNRIKVKLQKGKGLVLEGFLPELSRFCT